MRTLKNKKESNDSLENNNNGWGKKVVLVRSYEKRRASSSLKKKENDLDHKIFFVKEPTIPYKPSPFKNPDSDTLDRVKMVINGHAFKGGIKNSFYVERKGNHGLNSTVKEQRNFLSKEEIRDAFIPFSEIPNRNQLVRVMNGIKFVNDSFSVNLNSAWFSLEENEGPIVWIMGGLDTRNNNYQLIFELVKKKVKAIVFLGNQSFKTDQIFGKVIPFIFHTENMKDAVEVAYHLADRGDTVLLSPACSSLDMFENFEDRRNQFEKNTLALE